jgi:hypothetical protein
MVHVKNKVEIADLNWLHVALKTSFNNRERLHNKREMTWRPNTNYAWGYNKDAQTKIQGERFYIYNPAKSMS